MANAGFHYAPTLEEPDYCLCPFCGVSLANFEPEDDPRFASLPRRVAIHLIVLLDMSIIAVLLIAISSLQSPKRRSVHELRLCREVDVLLEQLR
jgi:hypothetical protein